MIAKDNTVSTDVSTVLSFDNKHILLFPAQRTVPCVRPAHRTVLRVRPQLLQQDQAEFEFLAFLLDDGREDGAGEEGQDGGQGDEAGGDQGREAGYQTGPEVGDQDRCEEDRCQKHQERRQGSEEFHGAVVLEEAEDGRQDFHAVRVGVEFGMAALGAVAVVDDDVLELHVLVDRVDGHLGLDLEAFREDREALDEEVAEGAAAGHDVPDLRSEEVVDAAAHEGVSEVVEGPLVLLKISGGQAVSYDHVRIPRQDRLHHLRAALGGIGVVPVHHDVTLGVDLAEHAADDVSFALLVFLPHDRAGGRGDLPGPVGGVVVVYVDYCFGEAAAPVADDFVDGGGFIVAGDQHCDLVHDCLYLCCDHPGTVPGSAIMQR